MSAHKYRTNIDNLRESSSISNYVTIIFCEYCGHIKYNANRSKDNELEPNENCPANPPKKELEK
jgi:hypothetical protein